MTIESSLFTTLSGHAGLAALIGTRIYPVCLPQEATLPCVVVLRVSTERGQGFGVTQPIVISRPHLRFSCWALTHDGALDVCAQLRAALRASGYPLLFGSEYTLRDQDSNYKRRELEVYLGHVGE